MGVKQYQLGKEHGAKRIPFLSHRRLCRMYDSKSAQQSYNNGYHEGMKLRVEEARKAHVSWA